MRTFPSFLVLLSLLLGTACRKGELNRNGLPETKISFEAINLSGDNRLNSSVQLSWFGTDPDGYVEAYEWSIDGNQWNYTQKQDSIFTFDIPVGQDSVDIDFYVRSIDNDGNLDPSPAYLKVPQSTPLRWLLSLTIVVRTIPLSLRPPSSGTPPILTGIVPSSA